MSKKVQTYDDCILRINNTRVCSLCGRTLQDGEECTCNKYKLFVRNMGLIDTAQNQVSHYQNTISELYDRMPVISYEIGNAVVPVPSTSEPPNEEDNSNSLGEPTEGGVK